MIFRSLFVLLCLAAPLLAQDAPKPAAPAEKPAAAAPEWQWQVPSRAIVERFSKLSEGARTHLQAEFASHNEALQALTLKEYNARFEKAFRAAVQEDEAKGLSSGGVPAEVFTERNLKSTRGAGGDDSSRRASRPGPSPAQKERWDKLSDTAKEKVKNIFRENRERLQKMTEEERRAFFESNFDKIEKEDAVAK